MSCTRTMLWRQARAISKYSYGEGPKVRPTKPTFATKPTTPRLDFQYDPNVSVADAMQQLQAGTAKRVPVGKPSSGTFVDYIHDQFREKSTATYEENPFEMEFKEAKKGDVEDILKDLKDPERLQHEFKEKLLKKVKEGPPMQNTRPMWLKGIEKAGEERLEWQKKLGLANKPQLEEMRGATEAQRREQYREAMEKWEKENSFGAMSPTVQKQRKERAEGAPLFEDWTKSDEATLQAARGTFIKTLLKQPGWTPENLASRYSQLEGGDPVPVISSRSFRPVEWQL